MKDDSGTCQEGKLFYVEIYLIISEGLSLFIPDSTSCLRFEHLSYLLSAKNQEPYFNLCTKRLIFIGNQHHLLLNYFQCLAILNVLSEGFRFKMCNFKKDCFNHTSGH